METISYLIPDRPTLKKGPQDSLDYGFDWAQWLANENNDAIASVQITGTGTLSVSGVAHQAGVVACVVAGGAAGSTERLTCRITTNASPARVVERSLWLEILQR